MSIGIGKYFYRFSLSFLLSFCLIGLTSSVYAMTYLEKDDKDITHRELSNFDSFLDKHPAIAKELRQNPSLVNDPTYLQNHAELREFLNNHPSVREEVKENPAVFMKREHRFDQSGQDIRRQELSAFDDFLDKHPAVAKDLRQNPSLVKDKTYLNNHAELREFLNNHPGVRQELREDPSVFMKRERRYDQSGQDITHSELDKFDDFLDKHPAVAKDLRQNPSLVKDKTYLNNHAELREFLNNHPGVRQELREDPSVFMKREHRFERHEGQNRGEQLEERGERLEERGEKLEERGEKMQDQGEKLQKQGEKLQKHEQKFQHTDQHGKK